MRARRKLFAGILYEFINLVLSGWPHGIIYWVEKLLEFLYPFLMVHKHVSCLKTTSFLSLNCSYPYYGNFPSVCLIIRLTFMKMEQLTWYDLNEFNYGDFDQTTNKFFQELSVSMWLTIHSYEKKGNFDFSR